MLRMILETDQVQFTDIIHKINPLVVELVIYITLFINYCLCWAKTLSCPHFRDDMSNTLRTLLVSTINRIDIISYMI